MVESLHPNQILGPEIWNALNTVSWNMLLSFVLACTGAAFLGLAHAIIPSWQQTREASRWMVSARPVFYILGAIFVVATVYDVLFTLSTIWYPYISSIYPRYLI